MASLYKTTSSHSSLDIMLHVKNKKSCQLKFSPIKGKDIYRGERERERERESTIVGPHDEVSMLSMFVQVYPRHFFGHNSKALRQPSESLVEWIIGLGGCKPGGSFVCVPI